MNIIPLTGILITDNRLCQRSWSYCAYLALFIPLSFVALFYFTGDQNNWGPVHAVYYTLVFSHITYRMLTAGPSSIAAPDTLFVLAFTLVNWGMVTSIWIGLVPMTGSDIRFAQSVPESLHLTTIGITAFLIGYELTGQSASTPYQTFQKAIHIPRQGWEAVGVALFLIGVLFHLTGLVMIGPDTIFRYGYVAIQDVGRFSDSAFAKFVLSLSIPISSLGIFTYIAASAMSSGKLFKNRIVLLLWIAWVLVILLEGDRGGVLKLTLPALLLLHYVVKPIKLRYLIALGLATTVIFSALAFVRNAAVFSPKQMIQEYLHAQESNDTAKWYSVVYEVGYSFQLLNITVNEVPRSEPYWLGASWRDAMIHVVPFAQGVALKQGFNREEPSTWVTVNYFGSRRAGKGFNVIAEGYLNFGPIGVLVQMLALGMLMRWLVRNYRAKPSTYRLIILLGGLAPTIMIIRNHTNLLFAPLVQVILFASALEWMLGSEQGIARLTEQGDTAIEKEHQ